MPKNSDPPKPLDSKDASRKRGRPSKGDKGTASDRNRQTAFSVPADEPPPKQQKRGRGRSADAEIASVPVLPPEPRRRSARLAGKPLDEPALAPAAGSRVTFF